MISPRPYLVASVEQLASPSLLARELQDEDIEHLGIVTAEALASTPDHSDRLPRDWAEELQREKLRDPVPGGSLLVAPGGEIEAFVVSHMWWGTPFVSHLMTRPRAQRRGYGTELMRAAADAARRQGHVDIALIVTRENPAFHFYGRLGFHERPRPN
jgi:GNAT superfamily N-acetyltransferase